MPALTVKTLLRFICPRMRDNSIAFNSCNFLITGTESEDFEPLQVVWQDICERWRQLHTGTSRGVWNWSQPEQFVLLPCRVTDESCFTRSVLGRSVNLWGSIHLSHVLLVCRAPRCSEPAFQQALVVAWAFGWSVKRAVGTSLNWNSNCQVPVMMHITITAFWFQK